MSFLFGYRSLSKRRSPIAVYAGLIAAAPAVSQAAVFTYTNLAALTPAGTTVSRSFALNDGGTLIGDYTTSAGTTFFTYAGGTLTPFPTVAGTQLSYPTQATNGGHLINDAGIFGASGALNTAEPSRRHDRRRVLQPGGVRLHPVSRRHHLPDGHPGRDRDPAVRDQRPRT